MRHAVTTAAAALAASLGLGLGPGAAHADEAACSALAAPGLFADTVVTSATWSPPAPAPGGAVELPGYCEVIATISPVEGSNIGVVYRLPETWNGKVLGFGGGGLSGNTALATAVDGLARGYATMQTDTGHPVPANPMNAFEASWMADETGAFHWEPLTDFAYRGLHLMTVVGKDVAARHYGRAHERSYYVGCSTGGRQGMMESQRFPEDYDGIVAGAPVFDGSIQTSEIVRANVVGADPARRLSRAQLGAVHNAVLAACDGRDGVEDGVITDPGACDWDPGALACPAGASADACLNPAQVHAVRTFYAGVTLADGRVAAHPFLRGSEEAWNVAVDPESGPVPATPNLAATVIGEFGVDMAALSPAEVVDRVRGSRFIGMYDADDADISAFAERGGKLILYHGLMDTIANPPAVVSYYEDLVATNGGLADGDVRDHARLFLVPGMGHCGGGPGANSADYLTALESWVETGDAPDSVLARRVASPFDPPSATATPELVRPVCAYPALPRYRGEGDPNEPESFACE